MSRKEEEICVFCKSPLVIVVGIDYNKTIKIVSYRSNMMRKINKEQVQKIDIILEPILHIIFATVTLKNCWYEDSLFENNPVMFGVEIGLFLLEVIFWFCYKKFPWIRHPLWKNRKIQILCVIILVIYTHYEIKGKVHWEYHEAYLKNEQRKIEMQGEQ